jgi:hypothetical protein
MVRKPTRAGTARILSEAFNAWSLPLKALAQRRCERCLIQAWSRDFGRSGIEHLFFGLDYFKNSSQTRELQHL